MAESETPTESAEEAAERSSLLTKAAARSEDALKRISSEIEKNERARDVRDKLTDAGRTLLHQLNLAPRDEVDSLRKQIEALEQRLAELEGPGKRPKASRASDD